MAITAGLKPLLREYERLAGLTSARVRASLRRATDALHRLPADRPPVIQVSGTVLFPRHEIFLSREKNLVSQLANIVLTLSHETDYVPFLDPFEGVTVLSEAFGCEAEVPENGDPWVREPLIRDTPEDVYSLKKPRRDNEVYARVFETLEYFERETGCGIPVGVTDPQGPLDVASLLWDNTSFLLACVTHKREVHHLLDLVTGAFIEFYSMQYERLKNPAFPVHSFPLLDSTDGISVSDDEAIVLSPGLYEEFGVPYLNRISKAFGGLYYHSCGDFGHLVDAICGIEGLRAINGHVSPREMRPESLQRIAGRGVGVFAGMSDREIGWEDPLWGEGELVDVYNGYYLPAVVGRTGGRGVVLVGYGGYQGYLETMESRRGDGGRDGREPAEVPGGAGNREPRDGPGGGSMLVGVGGHALGKSPLVDIPIEIKNENFLSILARVAELTRREGGVGGGEG